MFPAATKAGGTCAAFPDVCKVPAPPGPPVPTPFPNTAQCSSAKDTTKKVKAGNKPLITTKSRISRSSGDEAGTLKGMVSSTNMDQVQFKAGSSKVKIEGDAAVTHLKSTGHNGSNANAPPGTHVSPSQTAVTIG